MKAIKFARGPGLELGAPEVRVIPDPVRLADNGISARDLGLTIDALNDGLRVAEITIGGKRADLILMGPESNVLETQGIANLPVVTRSGDILPASALADIVITSGPVEIRHTERERTVTLQVRPAPTLALGAALEILEKDVAQRLRSDGIPAGVKIRMRGTADKLTQTWDVMRLNLLLALVIVYLVMAVLFRKFCLSFDYCAICAACDRRWCRRLARPQSISFSGARHADAVGIRNPDRHRREQCNFAGSSDALSYP